MGNAPEHLRTLVDRFDPAVFDAPDGKARIRLETAGQAAWDARIEGRRAKLVPASDDRPDALLSADEPTWRAITEDVRGGMDAYRKGKLSIRHNLHLGVGLLAATSGNTEPGRLEFKRAKTTKGTFSYLEAGQGEPILLLHGLGGTKASFLPTVSALAGEYRLIAPDHLGFGESDKPIAAPYDAEYFAAAITALMDELDVNKAHVVGNSMGGRVALELGFSHPDRVRKLVLLCPSLAWRRDRHWLPLVKVARPELGLLQLAPRPAVEGILRRLLPTGMDDWARVGLDEFLRSYLHPARPRRVLRGGATDLPGGAAWHERLLDAARGPEGRIAVRVGQARQDRADPVRPPRGERSSTRRPPGDRLRARASGGAPRGDPPGDQELPGEDLRLASAAAARGYCLTALTGLRPARIAACSSSAL